jgi:hypothetical protein
MAGVAFVHAGLTLLLLGAASLLRPLRFLGIRSRRAAGIAVGAGLASLAAGVLLPAPLRRAAGRRTLLEGFVAEYQFHERHCLRVHAPTGRVFSAIRAVTAREIRFFRLLTWIRSPRLRSARESVLAPPADRPILDVALHSGFVLLAEEPDREIVFGTILGGPPARVSTAAAFAAFDRPGFSKAVMNFLVEEEGSDWCRVTTETRVFSIDDSARRAFAVYWRMIYPGSSFIRRMWLQAVRRRAESVER